MWDIREKKKGEETLPDSKAFYRTLIDEAFDGIFVERGAKIIFANQRLHDMLGYRDGALIGMDHWLVYHPEHQKITRDRARARMRGEEPSSRYEVKLQRKDGSWFYGEISARVISFGGDPRVVVWIRDITARKQAEETLRHLKEYNERIVASIPASLLVLDRNLNIKSVNRTYRETRGITDEDVVGKNIKKVFPDQLLKDGGLLEAFEEVMTTKEPHSLYDVKHASSDHPEKTLNIMVSGLRCAEEEEEEEEEELILVIEDITERVRLREELRKKNKELENFVYIVSHDLKSPIVSIQGFSSMLLDEYREKLGEEGGRYLERIRANASRMEVLISDLLALSRVGRVVGAFKDVSSLDIVTRVCNSLKSRIEEKRVEVFITDDLPVIHCDANRIYQVFENLVVNAIKFTGDTEKPKIEIGYEERGESHYFYVRDNGIGIDPEYHGKIFDIFYKRNEIDDPEGTGFGLVIVKRIVNNHGGKVWVESEKRKGATFYFTLPGQSGQSE